MAGGRWPAQTRLAQPPIRRLRLGGLASGSARSPAPDAKAERARENVRKILEQRAVRTPFRLRKATYRGRGLRPEAAEQGWDRLRDVSYEGRGA